MKLCWQKMLFWHRICTTGTKTSSGPSSDATWSFSHSDVTAVVNRQTASRILTYNSLPVRLQLLDNEIQEHTWRRMTVQCDGMKSRNCTQRPGRRFCVGYEEACTQNTTTDLSTPGGRSVTLFLSPSLSCRSNGFHAFLFCLGDVLRLWQERHVCNPCPCGYDQWYSGASSGTW